MLSRAERLTLLAARVVDQLDIALGSSAQILQGRRGAVVEALTELARETVRQAIEPGD